jgi:uncharacterized protein (TIGR00159 family)
LEELRDILGQSWQQSALTVVDFVIVYYIIYRALLLIKGTRAVQVLIGLMAIIIFSFTSQEEFLDLPTVRWLLETFLGSFILISIVLFQDDIRRGLSQVGRTSLFAEISTRVEAQLLEEIVKGSVTIAQRGYGALIVIEREADLTPWTESGVVLDARISKQLLCALFIPERENPLHDGAVLIREEMIQAAGCFLPLSTDPEIDKHLGTRHRAGLGIAEQTDAAVIIISEETGMISVAWRAELIRGLDATRLRELLYHIFRHRKNDKEDRDSGSLLGWLRRSRDRSQAARQQAPPQVKEAPGDQEEASK